MACFRDQDHASGIVIGPELRPYVAREMAAGPRQRQRWSTAEMAVLRLMIDRATEPRIASVRDFLKAHPGLRSKQRSTHAILHGLIALYRSMD